MFFSDILSESEDILLESKEKKEQSPRGFLQNR